MKDLAKTKITAAEMELRREALRQAYADHRIEGLFPSPEGVLIFEAFVRGDIEHSEILPRLHLLNRKS